MDDEKKSGGFSIDLKGIKGMSQLLGSFTVLRMTSMIGMVNISFNKEELLAITKKLNRIKASKKN